MNLSDFLLSTPQISKRKVVKINDILNEEGLMNAAAKIKFKSS
jgi:hypothetical protein